VVYFAAEQRADRILSGDEEAKPAKTFRFYPKVYKAAIATANGTGTYEEYSEKVRELERNNPISMRHVMGLKGDRDPVEPATVDASIGHHDYPVVISSMSFGSQSEPAFRAYAEAAKSINVLCVNGEGGEIRDMYGHYRKWRGQQVASGRFGVSAEMLNSSHVAGDQDRPRAQARRGRPSARQEGLPERSPLPVARGARRRPDSRRQQPRPLLD
jgi:glutamate synthase domain-containing protein 2